jgi:flagellin
VSLLRINQNISSLTAQRSLFQSTLRIARSIERLSTGLRINRGADDPSGLVLSESLRWQVSGLAVAEQNALEGVNVVKTADGGLIEVQSLLRQIRDLAVDAASDSNNDANSRAALQAQVQSALAAIDQIVATTKYLNRGLLDGSAGIQVGVVDTTNIAGASFQSSAPVGYVDVEVTRAAAQAQAVGSRTFGGVNEAIGVAGTITINGVSLSVKATDTVQDVIDAINGMTAYTHVTATWDTDHVVLTHESYGSTYAVEYRESGDILFDNGEGAYVKEYGVDAAATVTYADGTTATYDKGKGLVLKDASGNRITLTATGNAVGTYSDALFVSNNSALSFQVGANVGERASIAIQAVDTQHLGESGTLASIDVSTVAGAEAALPIIDEAIQQVSALRGRLGAFQANELEPQARSIAVARENLAASESAIRDTDFGREMAEFTTAQILVQSATAFLTQANALPQAVLRLIAG